MSWQISVDVSISQSKLLLLKSIMQKNVSSSLISQKSLQFQFTSIILDNKDDYETVKYPAYIVYL